MVYGVNQRSVYWFWPTLVQYWGQDPAHLGADDPGAVHRGPPLPRVAQMLLRYICSSWNKKKYIVITLKEINLNRFSRFFSMGHFASQAWSPLHLAKSIITSLTLKTFLPFTFPPCSTFHKYNFFTSKAQYKAPTAFHRPNVLFYNKASIDREKQIFQLIELCSFQNK